MGGEGKPGGVAGTWSEEALGIDLLVLSLRNSTSSLNWWYGWTLVPSDLLIALCACVSGQSLRSLSRTHGRIVEGENVLREAEEGRAVSCPVLVTGDIHVGVDHLMLQCW